MKKYLFASAMLFCFGMSNLVAQDLHFSQFYERPLLRNPALAGVFDGDIRVKGTFREQWPGVTTDFKTGALSAEVKMPINNAAGDWITLGLEMSHDIAGSIQLKRTQLLPVVNYHKAINEDSYLSLAFMGGPVNTQFNPSLVKTDDQYNGIFPLNPSSQTFNNTGYTYWDLSTGLTYSSAIGDNTHFYVGAALHHFNNPKLSYFSDGSSFSILGRKLAINAGLSTYTSDNNKLQVFGDYFSQAGNEMTLVGMLYGVELLKNYSDSRTIGINFGGFYRWNDAFIPVINFDVFDFSLGFSYDVNLSRLKSASQIQGGFEMTGTYRARLNRRTAASDAVRCVKF